MNGTIIVLKITLLNCVSVFTNFIIRKRDKKDEKTGNQKSCITEKAKQCRQANSLSDSGEILGIGSLGEDVEQKIHILRADLPVIRNDLSNCVCRRLRTLALGAIVSSGD